MTRQIVPDSIIFGVATSAYQIEGAHNEDGKRPSMWDTFSHVQGNVWDGSNGDIACDHYHRYKEDVKLMKELGVSHYRFSISWPRVIPNGTGEVNLKGIEFYKNLIKELLDNGIKPVVTLYHWDLPQALQDKGGWENRETIDNFVSYSKTMFKFFGQYVPIWVTHNEPTSSAYGGYAVGEQAPGVKDYKRAMQVAHNILVSHGKVVKAFRTMNIQAKIGIVLTISPVYIATDKEEDILAGERHDQVINRWFTDALYKGSYPKMISNFFKEKEYYPEILDGDMETISEKTDFLGLNYYSRNLMKAGDGPVGAEHVKTENDYTEMNWEVYPQGIYDMLIKIKDDYGDIPVYITENGASFADSVSEDGKIYDIKRENYLREHLKKIIEANKDGANVKGYFLWSLMDNFEWAHGYSKRFGIVYVDRETLDRKPKNSYYFYQDVNKRRVID